MATVFSKKARTRIRQVVRTVEGLSKGDRLARRQFRFGATMEAGKRWAFAVGTIVAGGISNQVEIAQEDSSGVMQRTGEFVNDIRFIHIHRDGDGTLRNISDGRMVGIEKIDGEWHISNAQCEATPA